MSESMKKPLGRRILKWTLWSVLGGIVFSVLAIGIVVNFIFTSDKLTPMVEKVAAEYLNADLRFGKIELTFFSTFPDFGLEITDASVVSKALKDVEERSEMLACDSLMAMKSCLVTFNPIAYLQKKRIVIKDFVLDEPMIYAFIDSTGVANWDMMLPDTTVVDSSTIDTLQTDTSDFTSGIRLRNVRINGGNLIFDDRSTSLYAKVEGLDLSMDGFLGKRRSRLKLDCSTKNVLFWENGKLLVNHLALGVETGMRINRDSSLYTLEKAVFDINGVRFGAGGTLRGNSELNVLEVNLGYGIHIPSLKTLLDLVPAAILKKSEDVRVQGEVVCKGTLSGLYGKQNIPQLLAEFQVTNGLIAYPGMPSQIDTLNMDLKAFVDLEKQKDSYIQLRNFKMVGGGSTIAAEGEVEHLLTDPLVKAKINAAVDFEDFTKVFPWADGVTCRGVLNAGLQGKVLMSDFQNGDYGKIFAGGGIQAKEIEIFIPQDSIVAKVKSAGMAFASNRENRQTLQGKDLLNGLVGYSGLDIHVKNRVRLLMDTTWLTIKTSPLRDTTSVASMSSNVKLGRTIFIVRDTLLVGLKKATADARLEPSKRNNKIPKIHGSVVVDSLRMRMLGNRLNMAHAEFEVDAVQNPKNRKMWLPAGYVDFVDMQAYTPYFPLRIKMPGTRLQFNFNEILLDSAVVKMGRSDMRLTGRITNLARTFFKKDTLRGELLVSSRMINCNQLMKALEAGTEYMNKVTAGYKDTISGDGDIDDMKEVEVLSDSLSYDSGSSLFVVPPRVDFTFQMDVDRVKFGKVDLDSIHGEVVVRNQCVQLEDLVLKSSAANMSTSAVYRATDTVKAYAGFALQMHDIQVDSLVHLMPDLDTLFPMLRSFAGTVDFHIAADAWLDSTLMIDLPTLRGAAYLNGRNMVLMDGETFAEISKMLMFKNKERNMIDSISVDLSIKDGTVEIFPFMVEIDRYKAAVGGEHNIDMTFKYHISILKSPLPFKAGLDVSGNLDKMKFRITKAKYKDIFMPSKRAKVDSTQLNLKLRIRDMLKVGRK